MDRHTYRAQLKQGLGQFLLQMYDSYRQEFGEEKSKKIILDCIEEMYLYFSEEGVSTKQALEVVQKKINYYTEKMEQEDDYDTQMYYGEKISRLESAMEILKENNKGEV